MASTSFDVQIGSTKAKVLRSEDGGYRRRTLRREVEQQLLSQAETPAMVSRADQRQLYQTSWAGGSRWWKPLLAANEADSYFQANNMDVWSEPGKVLPGNTVTATDEATANDWNGADSLFTGDDGNVYLIGFSDDNSAGIRDVYVWTPASDTFVDAGYDCGIATTETPYSTIFDPSDDKFYTIFGTGGSADDLVVAQWDSGASDGSYISSTGEKITPGARIFLQRGSLLIYNGEEIFRVDKSGPSLESLADDGLGVDMLDGNLSGSGDLIKRNALRLATPTPEGVYYVKNVFHAGEPVPYVFRVDRDAAGSWIVSPIATLPTGTTVFSVQYHLGQLLVAAANDWAESQQNDEDFEVALYFVGSDGMGALGSPVGGRTELDETPITFLGSDGPLVYLAGGKRLWVYDAVRGGLHTAWEWPSVSSNFSGAPWSMSKVEDSSGDPIMIFFRWDEFYSLKSSQIDDPDTVNDFGDDETHYVLTSNFFDGGLPMETKELTKVQILHGDIDANGNQEWTVQISADGGSFSDALVNSTADSNYAEADLSNTTGRRFQYRLIYQTKDTERIPLEGLLVSFTTGEMVTEWDLTLDGAELLNVDNEVQDEQAFYDSLVTLAGTSTITTLVDNMQEQAQETDTGTTTNVKVQAVEISKTKPGESVIRVVLREA